MKLEEWELLDLKLRRQNKPPSRAREARYYGDPARVVEFESERRRREQARKIGQLKGGAMQRLSNREIADNLLMEWFRWCKLWRPNLGAPRVVPYCQQFTTSKQYDDPIDLAHDKVYQNQMHAVDFCIDAIAVPMQQAIGQEMRNREAKAKVWRVGTGKVRYEVALDAILPIMRKRGLFD
jgi:hypothetical protein